MSQWGDRKGVVCSPPPGLADLVGRNTCDQPATIGLSYDSRGGGGGWVLCDAHTIMVAMWIEDISPDARVVRYPLPAPGVWDAAFEKAWRRPK